MFRTEKAIEKARPFITPSGISSSIFTKTENRAIKNGELGHHFKTSKGYFGASLEYYVRLLCSVSA